MSPRGTSSCTSPELQTRRSCSRENHLPVQGAALGIKVTLQRCCGCPTAPMAQEGRGCTPTQSTGSGFRVQCSPDPQRTQPGHHSHQLKAWLPKLRKTNQTRILCAGFAKRCSGCHPSKAGIPAARLRSPLSQLRGRSQSWGAAGRGTPGQPQPGSSPGTRGVGEQGLLGYLLPLSFEPLKERGRHSCTFTPDQAVPSKHHTAGFKFLNCRGN